MKYNFICLPLFLFMLDVWRYQDAHWGGGLAREKEIHFKKILREIYLAL